MGEFPHSETSGSKSTYNSPKNIAVCRVLHRLLMPRHPPYALINLTTIISYLMSFEYLNINLPDRRLITHLHYLVFKEQNLREIISQNQVKRFVALRNLFTIKCASPEDFIRLFFYFNNLHRKEVIHPHVLVGIPCYDFTPVTCPTLGGPIPKGLSYRLQVLQTPMA